MEQATAKTSGTYSVLASAQPVALVLYCGDPRFQEAIEQFLENELGLKKGQYVPLVPPGGAASLLEPFSLPKEFKYVSEAIGFYVDHFDSISQVIVINHEDCGKYRALHELLGTGFLSRATSLVDRQRRDLVDVLQTILRLAPRRVEVHRFYAKFANPEKTKVVFEKVST